MNPNITIDVMSVKVMRSFDYSHFEIQLSSSKVADGGFSPEDVDQLRKVAARLADKAVEQYKVAKLQAELKASLNYNYETLEIKDIKAKSETDRTPEEKAKLKAREDEVFRASRDYDYQDVWQNDDY